MCGIIAAFNTPTKKGKKVDNVNESIIAQYQEQYSRGTEGYGIIRINKNKTIEIDRSCQEAKFLIDLYLKPSKMIIAHHRTPTSTTNKIKQTHPIFVSNELLKYDYLIVHNGIVHNDETLHEKHTKLGFKYTTEYDAGYTTYKKAKWNDSEAIAIEFAMFIEGGIKEIDTESSAALIAVQINKTTQKAKTIFFGRNGFNPLNINQTNGQLRISSEGEGTPTEQNRLYSFEINDPTMTIISENLPFKTTIAKSYTTTETTKALSTWPTTETETTTKEAETGPKEEDEEFAPRAWNAITNLANIKYEDYENLTSYADKNYIGTACQEFKKEIEGETSTTITQLIDDTLEAELQKITDISSEYKSLISQNKTDKHVVNYYIEQIEIFMKTMNALANIADMQYQETLAIEANETKEWNNSFEKDNAYQYKGYSYEESAYDDELGGKLPYGRRNYSMGFGTD